MMPVSILRLLRSTQIVTLLGIGLFSAARTYAADTDPALDLAGDASEVGLPGSDLIRYERIEVSPGGEIVAESTGDLVVQLSSGSPFEIDLDDLSDPDGNRYTVVGDSFQESPTGPVIHEVRLVRYTPGAMSDADVADAWWEAHPDGSDADWDAFLAERETATVLRPPPLFVDPDIESWLATAGDDDSIELVLVFEYQPPLDLPRANNSLIADSPVEWIANQELRILEIEDRKSLLFAWQEDWLAPYVGLARWDVEPLWVFNGMQLRASRELVEALLADPELARIEVRQESEPAVNTGLEILNKTQLMQYVQAGVDQETASSAYDGHRPSGRATNTNVGAVYGGIWDDSIDLDHPLWWDATSPSDSRLIDNWRWNPNLNPPDWELSSVGTSAGGSLHGNRVATQFLADLTDDQDSDGDPTHTGCNVNVPDVPSTQYQYSGTSHEVEFSFLMAYYAGGSVTTAQVAELAMELGLDVLNASRGCSSGGCVCNPDHSNALAVDQMFHDGILVVAAAGNENGSADPATGCQTRAEASASGAFSVAAYDKTATDLNAAPIWATGAGGNGSSRGGDSKNRPVVDVTAPSGREGSYASNGQGCYTTMGNGTSYATPAVAGAAANLKDFIVGTSGTGTANQVGLLFAHLLLMGDGKLETGSSQLPGTPVDPRWGVGRLRARMFNNAGMDYPWRRRWAYWTNDHGETYSLPLNPNGSGTNQVVPSDAEWFRAALWFHEPNLSPSVSTSSVSLKVCKDGTSTCYSATSWAPQSQRLWLGNVLGGYAWTVTVNGITIPASDDPYDPLYGEAKRKMFLALYWEDRDRDDGDGPDASIQ